MILLELVRRLGLVRRNNRALVSLPLMRFKRIVKPVTFFVFCADVGAGYAEGDNETVILTTKRLEGGDVKFAGLVFTIRHSAFLAETAVAAPWLAYYLHNYDCVNYWRPTEFLVDS